MDLQKICVVGTGTMGRGIAQTFAQAGYKVVFKGIQDNTYDEALPFISKNLEKMVSKGRLDNNEKVEILSNISITKSFEECSDCDFFIEAVSENIDSKHAIFAEISKVAKDDAVLATNTSSLSITEIAAKIKNPGRVIGMHFFNPVPVMKLVEVIKGQVTEDSIHNKVYELAQNIGKTPVSVNEGPGFVVNRMLIPLINEGIGILGDGIASKEEIDIAMKLGANHPMGPLELGDLIGLDVCLAIMEVLYNEFGDSKYRPHPLLRKMVRANHLGRKTGRGFYDYDK